MVCKVGICVAYDWEFLKLSLPVIYREVDSICLSIDKSRTSWNGNLFDLDQEAFYRFVQEMDTDLKIKILEEDFYAKSRSPIENECYQRQRMAEFLGAADWIIQIDTDEIIINFNSFKQELKKHQGNRRPLNIHGMWINLIKQTPQGFIYSVLPTPPLATNHPQYEYGRTSGHFNIYTNCFIAHITWARPEQEVRYKLQNWGHSHEFNGMSFFKIWEALDDFNWLYIKDFHPMSKTPIPNLYYQMAGSIEELIVNIDSRKHHLTISKLLNNKIWVSRLKKVLKVFYKGA